MSGSHTPFALSWQPRSQADFPWTGLFVDTNTEFAQKEFFGSDQKVRKSGKT